MPREDLSSWHLNQRWLRSPTLSDGRKRATWVGSGTFGDVFVHPHRDTAVVKVIRGSDSSTENARIRADEDLMLEDAGLHQLARIGISPRPLAHATIDGHSVSIRERILGRTVYQIGRDRNFGARERALVQHMVKIIAEAGFEGTDLKLDNIMIGIRPGDTRDQAWFVDPMTVLSKPSSDPSPRRRHMLEEVLRPVGHPLLPLLSRRETLEESLERLMKKSRN